MNATGFIRRIDDLGRVVIPRHIYKAMGIKEGDHVELFTSQMGHQTIIGIRKYEVDIKNETSNFIENVEAFYEGNNKEEIIQMLDAIIRLMQK